MEITRFLESVLQVPPWFPCVLLKRVYNCSRLAVGGSIGHIRVFSLIEVSYWSGRVRIVAVTWRPMLCGPSDSFQNILYFCFVLFYWNDWRKGTEKGRSGRFFFFSCFARDDEREIYDFETRYEDDYSKRKTAIDTWRFDTKKQQNKPSEMNDSCNERERRSHAHTTGLTLLARNAIPAPSESSRCTIST